MSTAHHRRLVARKRTVSLGATNQAHTPPATKMPTVPAVVKRSQDRRSPGFSIMVCQDRRQESRTKTPHARRL